MPTVPKTKAELEQLVQELRAELAKLRLAISDSSELSADRFVLGRLEECAFIVSDDGVVHYASPNVGRVFRGISTEAIERQSIAKLLGDWCLSCLPAQADSSSEYRREIKDAHGASMSVRVAIESIRSELGSALIRCVCVDSSSIRDATYQQRDRYQRLVEGLSRDYFFFATNAEGNIKYISPTVKDVLGFEPEQVVGKNWRDFVDITRVENEEVEELDRRRFAGEARPPAYEVIVRTSSGGERLVEVLDIPVLDAANAVIENEGICHDITDARRAEEKARAELERCVAERTEQLDKISKLYKSVVDVQTEFIVRWLPDGTRTFVNPAYCEYARMPAKELIGKMIRRLSDPIAGAGYRQQLLSLTPDRPELNKEICIIDDQGHEVWQHWKDHAIFDSEGKLIEVQSVGRDVTAHRRKVCSDKQAAVFKTRLESLSPRERQVMELVTDGMANKVIARNLELSVKTVEKHRSSMMRKLQVQSVAQLVRNVLQVEKR